MPKTVIWSERNDTRTNDVIKALGGTVAIQDAVGAVLPGRRVKLQAMTPGASGSVVFLASPEIMHSGRRVPEVTGVLKVGPARLLANEVERYERWVDRVLAHSSHFAPLIWSRDLPEIASRAPAQIHALHYRHVGHKTFGDRAKDLIAADDAPALFQLIDSLLAILHPWQEMANPIMSKALTSEGVYSFASDPFDVLEQTCDRLNAELGQDDSLDPGVYRRVRELWREDALSSDRHLQTIVHGDLHIDNILLDSTDAPTLIDFGATGEGHFLRDLATLEAHLVLRGLAPRGDRVGAVHREYVESLRPLYKPRAFLQPDLVLGDSLLAATVTRLRKYSYYCLMRGNPTYMPQYALALLRHAVRLCIRADAAYTDAQRWAAASVTTVLGETLTIENHHLTIRSVEPRPAGQRMAFLDAPSAVADPLGVSAPKIEPCTPEQWEALASALRSAKRVDFVGVVPVPLVSALLSAWEGAGALPQVRYLTLPASPGPRANRSSVPGWRTALTGMRNVANLALKAQFPMDRFAQVSDSATTNCLIRTVAAGGSTSAYLASQVPGPGLDNLHTLSFLPDIDGGVGEMIDRTFAAAEPLITREVDCRPLDDADTARADLRPQAMRLSLYGDPTPRTRYLRPIALTILRSAAPNGWRAMVKLRSPLVDHDDFDKFSFLSARILAEDVANTYGKQIKPAENAEDAFTELWEGIGSPRPFQLTEEVFITAAMRDVYETTLLELDADRFTRRGFLIMPREHEDVQLGFSVLTVDLKQHEVVQARKAAVAIGDRKTPLLRTMDVDDLLSGQYPVNRIMRERKDWLIEHCLGRHVN